MKSVKIMLLGIAIILLGIFCATPETDSSFVMVMSMILPGIGLIVTVVGLCLPERRNPEQNEDRPRKKKR